MLHAFIELLTELWAGLYSSVKAAGLYAAVHNKEVSETLYQTLTNTSQQDTLAMLEQLLDMITQELEGAM